ncbi:MAG TPA: CHAT domain-containing protein [Cyclobacteriaceae bacterium]|jgi:CHAT domain-containing protein/Flp pilus assembly protein TadD|nr:CHAT domain-containing protein [Cytophagales bacterium]HRE65866.1 CHAT domain-containing protein [Cyclobacteriaceae bacterium]HRF33710.1 CHAT domain-containing protein [Cyclobacteriaceae bacterium]
MKKLIWFILLMLPLAGYSQFQNLKNKVVQKTKEAAKGKAADKADAARDRLDSTDFNYAITVIDNSGMMNVLDADEIATRTAYMASNKYMKKDSDITAAERCRSILDQAENFYQARKYKLAEVSFLEAKIAFEASGLTGNINYSKVHADLGLLYSTMGRFNQAEYFLSEGLGLREQTLGRDSKAGASSLNNLAVLYQETARFNEAETYFQEALNVVDKQFGKESHEYAVVLNNQAIFFAKVGRTDQAVSNLNTAIGIVEKINSKSKRTEVGFQSNLAMLYQEQGKLTEAEAVYLKLEKMLRLLGDKTFYAGVLNNLALLYIQMEKVDKVENYLKEAAQIYQTKLGKESPNYAKVLGDLGNFYRMQGRYAEAEENLNKSLTINGTALNTNHPDYVKAQEDLAILYWKKGDMAKADASYTIAMDKSLEFINQYFPPMSEAEKTKYWDVLQPRFQRYYNYCLDASAGNPASIQTMLNYQLTIKGLLLNSTNKVKKAILSGNNTELIKDYTTWLDKKETLARYYSLSKEDLTNQNINLAALEAEANTLERSLSQRSTDFSQGYTTDNTDYKQIQSTLTDTEALIEFIRIRSFDKNFTTESKYAALVLTKGVTDPKLVILDNGNQLETRYAKFYRNAIQNRQADAYSYEQFWARVEVALTGKKVLYISTDGVYNQISLNTLKKPDGDYLINRYDIVLVGNSKDVLTLKAQKTTAPKKNAFVLGFPDYGGDAVPALPGTKTEADNISRILKAGGYQVTSYLQKTATEASIKALKGPALVHIATHGYFQADVDQTAAGVHQENAKNNPLLRSGLLLAGASPTLKGELIPNLESNDNGVLTAYEAMNLSLEGTDLIVVSACETGLGDVRAGEGVYGLQRSFIVAGAKAMVMSLWKVDDAATQTLMTNFYTNLSKGGTKAKAFKQAQLQLMTKYKEPYYWGAFVMTGM